MPEFTTFVPPKLGDTDEAKRATRLLRARARRIAEEIEMTAEHIAAWNAANNALTLGQDERLEAWAREFRVWEKAVQA